MTRDRWEAVVMGGSAGSLEALTAILPDLPENFPLPILAVVHLPADKKSMLPEVLRCKCRLRVCEAQDKEPIQPGTVYFAPPDYHLLVECDRHIALSYDEPLRFSRPSIDVLFESAADVYGESLVGVVLSGANSDGANGLATVLAGGGVGVVQSPGQAYSTAMPLAALEKCPTAEVMVPGEIAGYLKGLCNCDR